MPRWTRTARWSCRRRVWWCSSARPAWASRRGRHRSSRSNQIVSSDDLRAVVGDGPHDLTATADAFALVEEITTRRLGRGLTTVIDSLALDPRQRGRWRDLGRAAGVPCIAIAVDSSPAEIRQRNRGREDRVPDAVLRSQLEKWPAVLGTLPHEGFDEVHVITVDRQAALVPAHLAPRARNRPPTRSTDSAGRSSADVEPGPLAPRSRRCRHRRLSALPASGSGCSCRGSRGRVVRPPSACGCARSRSRRRRPVSSSCG